MLGDPGRDPADPAQPGLERGEVHRGGRGVGQGPRDRRIARDRVALRFEVTDTGIGIAEQDQAPAVRVVLAGRRLDDPPVRRHWSRAGHLAAPGRGDGGRDRRATASRSGAAPSGSRSRCRSASAPSRSSRRPSPRPAERTSACWSSTTTPPTGPSSSAQLPSWHLQRRRSSTAPTAFERLRAAASDGRPYDVAILDLMMPDVDGLELARQITADPLLTGMPMIMLTSELTVDPQVLAAAGIGQWLSKPVRSSRALRPAGAADGAEGVRVDRPGVAPGRPRRARRPGRVARSWWSRTTRSTRWSPRAWSPDWASTCTVVEDGVEALRALEQRSYHAVLMDCHMPRDGRLRRHPGDPPARAGRAVASRSSP